MPVGALSLGRYFNPVVGLRLNGAGYRSKGSFKNYDANGDRNYYYNYVTTDLDLLINLTNLFGKKDYHAFNVVLIGGAGLNYAWHNRQANNLLLANPSLFQGTAYETWNSRFSHNLRVGLQAELNIAKHWSANLEVQANNLNDQFNVKQNNKNDWQMAALVGLTYKFGYKPRKVIAPTLKAVAARPAQEIGPTLAKAKPVAERKIEKIREDLFFSCAKSELDEEANAKIDRIVSFLERNTSTKVEITGYADKGTGNETINMKYSKERAEKVKDALIKKGIAAERITVDAKGDSVQPYEQNDKNRLVICIGQ